MNDLAGIIAEQRKDLLEPFEMLLLQEKAVALDKRGKIEKKKKYQPIDTRIQFIYKMLTNESIDRSSSEWHNIMHLKNARDSYIHRVGKDDSKKYSFFDEKIVFKGFKSIQRIIAHVFKKTPEFSEIFAYKFLAFWSCQNDLPFFGDGMGGDSFYLGLVEIKPQALIDLYAPMPSSFSLFT